MNDKKEYHIYMGATLIAVILNVTDYENFENAGIIEGKNCITHKKIKINTRRVCAIEEVS